VNDRQGDTAKGHRQADLPASSIVRASRSPAREADSSARVCAGHGVRARDRIEGETTDPVGKATTATDPAVKTRSNQRDGESSRKGRNNVDPAGKAATATDPAKATEGVGGGACQAGQGPAPDLAKGVDGTGDGRSSKWEALLGRQHGQHVRGHNEEEGARAGDSAKRRTPTKGGRAVTPAPSCEGPRGRCWAAAARPGRGARVQAGAGRRSMQGPRACALPWMSGTAPGRGIARCARGVARRAAARSLAGRAA
jgi:hypothetical protein